MEKEIIATLAGFLFVYGIFSILFAEIKSGNFMIFKTPGRFFELVMGRNLPDAEKMRIYLGVFSLFLGLAGLIFIDPISRLFTSI